MGADAQLHAAVINNALWCAAVCRSHGYHRLGRRWPLYPGGGAESE